MKNSNFCFGTFFIGSQVSTAVNRARLQKEFLKLRLIRRDVVCNVVSAVVFVKILYFFVPVELFKKNISFSYTQQSKTLYHQVVRVILFCVRVPVLSEQMQSAPPIVSQAYSFLTRLLSLSIFLTE